MRPGISVDRYPLQTIPIADSGVLGSDDVRSGDTADQSIIETGCAQRTVFPARYLSDPNLQCEVNECLNVIEARNRGNSILFYGKGGDIASNRRDEQQLSVLCLRVLQAALVDVKHPDDPRLPRRTRPP